MITWAIIDYISFLKNSNSPINTHKIEANLHSAPSIVHIGVGFLWISQLVLGLAHITDPDAPVHYAAFANPEFLDALLPEYNIWQRNEFALHAHGEMEAAAVLLGDLGETIGRFEAVLRAMATSPSLPNSEIVFLITLTNAIMETIDEINEIMPRWFYDAVIVEGVEADDVFDDAYFDNLQRMFDAYVGFAEYGERFKNLAEIVELHFYDRGQELNIIDQAQLERAHVQTNIGDEVDRNANIRNPVTLTLCMVVFLLVGAGMVTGVGADTSSLSSSMSF